MPLFVDVIQKSAIEPVKIMWLYSKVARIRLTSSDQVLRAAEEVGKRLLEFYERPSQFDHWRVSPGRAPPTPDGPAVRWLDGEN